MADIEMRRSQFANEIWKSPRQPLSFGDSDTLKSFTIQVNGVVSRIILEIPDWTNAPNTTLTIENSDGKEIYNSGAKTENQTLNLKTDVEVVGENTVKVALSGAPGGAGGDVYVTLYLF